LVFDSGTDANSAEALRELEKHLHVQEHAAAAEEPHEGATSSPSQDEAQDEAQDYHELCSSPLASVTLPDAARKAASIPPEANFCARSGT
jgi:hypothetical protein